jgi:hypothetical protein
MINLRTQNDQKPHILNCNYAFVTPYITIGKLPAASRKAKTVNLHCGLFFEKPEIANQRFPSSQIKTNLSATAAPLLETSFNLQFGQFHLSMDPFWIAKQQNKRQLSLAV